MTTYNQTLLNILEEIFPADEREKKRLLEIASESGELALFLAPHFSNLTWTTSEKKEKLSSLKKIILDSKIANIQCPLCYEVGVDEFPKNHAGYNYLFVNNLIAYLTWKQAKGLMKTMGNRMREGSQVFITGPLKYNGHFLSEIQESFDKKLKEKDSKLGIRSFEDICDCMKKNGFDLYQDFELPELEHLLVFTRLERVVLGE